MIAKSIFILTFFTLFATISCANEESCNVSDESCLTNAAKPLFKKIVAGKKEWGIGGSDPLNVAFLEAKLPNLSFNLTNASLQGVQDCDVYKLKIKVNPNLSCMHLVCPKLHMTADYALTGFLIAIPIEAKGRADTTYVNIEIIINSDFEIVTGSDGKTHFNITAVRMDQPDIKDGITYNWTNTAPNKLQSENKIDFININWRKISTETDHTIIEPFMKILMSNINKFSAVIPKDEVFHKKM